MRRREALAAARVGGNAFEQAKAAALNMIGRPTVHDRVPWFWSDQYDDKLLIVGLSQDYDSQVLRGDPASRSFGVCYLKARELLAAEAINHSKDLWPRANSSRSARRTKLPGSGARVAA